MPVTLHKPQASMAGVTPDINVTPLVDVCLVLLIIFMVVAPQLENDVPVDLPAVFNADPEAKSAADPLEISVAKNGTLWVDKAEVDLASITSILTDMKANEPSRRIVIRADQGLGFAKVRGLFTTARKSGYSGVSLMVNEKEGEPAPDAPVTKGDEHGR